MDLLWIVVGLQQIHNNSQQIEICEIWTWVF